MSEVPELLRANARHAATFSDPGLAPPPRRRLAILTCMDARLNPGAMLGLNEGDAHILRNAGGRVTDDVIRSLILSQQLLGTREVVVIHHTECGLHALENEPLREQLETRLSVDAGEIDFLPIDDAEQGVRDDIATLRQSPFIPDDIDIHGFIYDVRSGRLHEVA